MWTDITRAQHARVADPGAIDAGGEEARSPAQMGMAQDPRLDVLPFARRLAVAHVARPVSAFFDRAALVLSVARQRIVARHQS